MRRKSKAMSGFLWVVVPLVACGCAMAVSGPATPGGPRPPGCRVETSGPPPHAPAHGHRRKYSYLYYPRNDVYYSADRKVYFYLEGDGWKMGATLPGSIALRVEDAVAVELDTELPYASSSNGRCARFRGKGKSKKRLE